MSSMVDMYVLAIEMPNHYNIFEIPEEAWKKLSPTLRLHRLAKDHINYHIKAQTWCEDQVLDDSLSDFHATLTGAPF